MIQSQQALRDSDEQLDAAAQGYLPDEDEDNGENADEIAAMGEAAGISIPDGKPLGAVDPRERRDAHRWELSPESAEDADTPELDGSNRNERGESAPFPHRRRPRQGTSWAHEDTPHRLARGLRHRPGM